MRIGFVTPEFPGIGRHEGGLAAYTRRVAAGLSDSGHDVVVFTSASGTVPSERRSFRIIQISQKDIRPLWAHGLPGVRRFSPLQHLRLGHLLADAILAHHRDSAFNIIQVPSYGSLGNSLLRKRPCPVICRISSYGPSLRRAFGREATLPDRLADHLELRAVKHSNAAFAPSRYMAQVYKEEAGISPEVIPTPPPTSDDLVGDTILYEQVLEGKKYLVFIGNFSRVKGIDLFIEVLPDVLQKTNDLHIVFIGRDDGLPGGRSAREAILATCQPWNERIHVFPSIASRFILPVIEHSVGLVAPSRVDNYPNACLEAHALGVPIVGTKNSSLDEIIEDNTTGFLVENNNARSLLKGVERLLTLPPEKREQMRAAIVQAHQSRVAKQPLRRLEKFYAAQLTAR